MSYTRIHGLGIFGDGADGTVTISSNTNLARDMYYDVLTVSSNLTTNGFRIHVKTRLIMNGGTIRHNGNNGANNGINIAPGSGGTMGVQAAGGAGGTAGGGTGGSQTTSLGGAGGAGGSGASGSGGAAGTVTQPTANQGGAQVIKSLPYAGFLTVIAGSTKIKPGSGGGGGGGDGTRGAGGAVSGGMVYIAARQIKGTGNITANGGNGGSPVAGNRGGGGGGGGGVIIIAACNDVTAESITITANGGNGGTATGTGTNGSAGSAGTIQHIRVGL